MRSENKDIEKPDDFSRIIGEKLREHRLSVDPDVWDSLADRLPPREKPAPAYWSWAAAGVAAALLVLFFFLNPFAGNHPVEVAQEDPGNRVNPQSDVSAEEPASADMEERTKHPMFTQHTQPQKRTKENGTVSEVIPDKMEEQIEKESSLPEIFPEEITESIVPAEPEAPSRKEEPATTETETYPADVFIVDNDVSSFVQEQHGLRSLIATLGSGGALLDFSFGSYDMDNAIYDSPVPGSEYSNGDGLGSGGNYTVLSPGDYTDIEHRLPVSLSLMADFKVGKNVNMETGLSYTYLFSRFSRNDHFVYRGTLQQHYIGIPFNLRYSMWQDGAWNIYLLGGGSIEKGLRAVYEQEIVHNGGVVQHTNVHSRIGGFQLSAQGGAGFSYQLHDNLNLFGEPRLIYYFRNNQPMSARTENPLIFGLNIGIRIQFK